MVWLERLNHMPSQPLLATLGETYSVLLERLGTCSPFELAILGGRSMPTPGLAFCSVIRPRCGFSGPVHRRALVPCVPASDAVCARPTCKPGLMSCA